MLCLPLLSRANPALSCPPSSVSSISLLTMHYALQCMLCLAGTSKHIRCSGTTVAAAATSNCAHCRHCLFTHDVISRSIIVFLSILLLPSLHGCPSSPNCLLGAVPYISLALRGCHGLQASPKLRHRRCLSRQLGYFPLYPP
jgi:hypothetical protein